MNIALWALNSGLMDYPQILGAVQELAEKAGRAILRYYGSALKVTSKADRSPLTDADKASHELLVAGLQKLTPDWPVISEESAGAAIGVPSQDRFWLVDPLDGTKEFVKGTNEFTVNVALIEGTRPVLGVVHAPALKVTYSGLGPSGAWRTAAGQGRNRISTRPAELSHLSVVASKDHAGPLVRAMLDHLPSAELQSMGSSLKFCLVAEGKADLYLRDLPTMEWDTAAAQCVVEAAGGAVYELSGAPLAYGKPGLRNRAIMTVGDVSFPWRDYVQNPVLM